MVQDFEAQDRPVEKENDGFAALSYATGFMVPLWLRAWSLPVDKENDGFAVLSHTKLGIGKVDVKAVTLARAVTHICPYPRAVLPPVEVWCLNGFLLSVYCLGSGFWGLGLGGFGWERYFGMGCQMWDLKCEM
jgi:hypothetical protein